MSVENAILSLKNLNFKEINSDCSKQDLNLRIDEYSQRKFEAALKTVNLLVSQPIELAISRQTKMDASQSLRDVKKVLDSLNLKTKDNKYKDYSESLNELMTSSKLK